MRPCKFEGCERAAAQQRRTCWSHSRSFRICEIPDCTKRSQHPLYLHCVKHGGGYRCTAPDCSRSRQFRYLFCRWHQQPEDAGEALDHSSNVSPPVNPS
jgi:hypothetical protein